MAGLCRHLVRMFCSHGPTAEHNGSIPNEASQDFKLSTDTTARHGSHSHLWISITSSAIMRPILPAPALVPPGMPGTVCSARLPPPVNQNGGKKFYEVGPVGLFFRVFWGEKTE